jgi:uncharacterized protein (TIGR00251 family)
MPPHGIDPITNTSSGCVLSIRVIPRAKRTELAGQRESSILIRLAAPPVEGAANDALIAFLSELLHVPKRAVTIVSGEQAREKRVRIDGLSAADARVKLTSSR